MKTRKMKQLLSFMLACLLVLNVPLPALGAEEIQMISAEQADETQAPEMQTPETQAPGTETLDAQAPDILAQEEEILDAEEPDTDVLEMQISDAEKPDAGIADTGVLGVPEADADIPELETVGQGTQETVPGLDEELVIADGDVPTEAVPETETSKLPASDLEESESETEADEETEEETAPEAALAGVQFALAEPGEDAGQEAYLASRQDEQDGSYIVILPVTEEPIETIYVKPELTDPVCFAFAKAGENEAVELTDQAWTAVDIRALEVPAQEEAAVILTVSAMEDAEAEDAAQYAVRFEQETTQPESGTETEEGPETEEATEVNTEEAAETSNMEEAVSEASDTEMWTEVDTETETETMPEEVLETETEAMNAANAGESESGSESESGNESESETKPEMKPTSVLVGIGTNGTEAEQNLIEQQSYDEANHIYTFAVPVDKINPDGNVNGSLYVKIGIPEGYTGYVKTGAGDKYPQKVTSSWRVVSSRDMTVSIEWTVQVGTLSKWNEKAEEKDAQFYTIRIQSEKQFSAKPSATKREDVPEGYFLNDQAKPLAYDIDAKGCELAYQWYKKVDNVASKIEGERGETYTPPTDTAGSFAYYLEITATEVDKLPIVYNAPAYNVAIASNNLDEYNKDKYSRTETYEMTLPWDKEHLSSSSRTINAYVVVSKLESSYSDFSLSGQWYRSTKQEFDETAEKLEGGSTSLQGRKPTDIQADSALKKLSYTLPATTKTGTYYYFVKASLSCRGQVAKELTIGPMAVTIQAPAEIPYGVIVGEDPIGNVKISIEDSTQLRTDLKNAMGEIIPDIGPAGSFLSAVSVPLYPSDSMMTLIARTCLGYGLTQEGAEEGYIKKITRNSDGVSREEFDRGQQSGWMGTLNEWITGQGFQRYTAEAGWLKDGTVIKLLYTTDLGEDLGGGFSQKEDYGLKSLKINSGENDQLQPAFSKENDTYDAFCVDGKVTVDAEVANKQMRLRIFKGAAFKEATEYSRGESIAAEEGDVLQIVVCGEEWKPGDEDAQNQALAKIYTVNVIGDRALPTSNIKINAITENGTELAGSAVTLTKNISGNRRTQPPHVYFDANFGTYSVNPAKNPVKVKITLTGLADDAAAAIAPVEGEGELVFEKTADGLEVVLADGFASSGTWYYRIRLQTGGKNIFYWLRLRKSAHSLTSLQLQGDPKFGALNLNGKPEGTLFQVGGNGEETGATGFAPDIYRYNLYVTPGIQAVGPAAQYGITDGSTLGFGTAELFVGDELKLTGISVMDLSKQWYEAFDTTVQIKQDDTLVRLKWKGNDDSEDDVLNFEFHIIRKAYDVSDLEALIDALPAVDALEYPKHYDAVHDCWNLYDGLDEELKGKVRDEAVEKLKAALAMLDVQKEIGDKQIADLVALVDSYKNEVTGGTEMTAELYQQHGENIRKSRQDYDLLNGWVAEEFAKSYSSYPNLISAAYKIVNRYEIAAGNRGEKAINYEDEFMVSGNAFNLTLGAAEDAYPITFRDIIYSDGTEEGKPYNTPGRLQYKVEDESIVTIREELTTYTDMGLGGGGKGHENLKYYLIPHAVGTTTLTVNLADDQGTYYGQIPKIIIHVNSPDEASIEEADKKLTDFYDQQYTTKYDTWHYIEGTGGAPFTFHVYGKDPQVTVWSTDNSDKKVSCPVAADGSATVYLKDGYNPIEVTGTLDGKRITQVYGLRGKAISVSVENKYRAGQPLRQGDTAVIKMVGLNRPVHKIGRIYNPWGGVIWTYNTSDLPGQGSLRAEIGAGQYGTGYLEILLTGSGKITLTDGRIEEVWLGSGLYSEAEQGNTGGIAAQGDGTFSHLPDIVLDVAEAPEYIQSFRIHPRLLNDGILKAGSQATIEIPDLPVAEITDEYPFMTNSTTVKFQSAQTMFMTDIPNLSAVTSAKIENPKEMQDAEIALRGLKAIRFTVPEDTPTGTYRICGGYVNVRHGDSAWTISTDRMFGLEIEDISFQVVNPKPGQHTCDWGEGKVTKTATCTEDGVRTYTCSICGETKTETILSRGGHKYDAGKEVQAPTCVKAGIRMYTCSACGQAKTEQIPATGEHSFDEGKETQAPTCGQEGVRTYTCKTCSETKTESIPATGKHTFDKWKTVEKATVFAAKKQTRTCTVCGETQERTVGKKLKPTIKLNVSKIVLKEKQSTTALKVSGLADGDSVVSYKSGNKKIFKVSDSGKITAGSKKGKAKLTITLASGKKKTVTVVVQKTAVKTTKVSGLDKKMTIRKGKKATLKPQLTPVTSKQKITYKSSNKKVAAVTGKGVIKAKKKGKATITVQSGNVKFKVKVTVK